MPIFAVKTTASQEGTVADMIASREERTIHAVLAPDALTSYVLVEADDDAVFERVLDEIPHARSVVPGTSSMGEVEHFLSPTPDVEGIAEGKDQVTVELYEATVPIPVTVRGDQIRVLDSEER